MIRIIFILTLSILLSCTPDPTKETKLLAGRWKVKSASVLPFEHISFCKSLGLNSLFEFNIEGRVKVFTSDTAKESCISYQTFSVDSSKITFLEGDMVFYYDLLKLTSDSLIFRNWDIPEYLINENIHNTNKDSLIKSIKKEGIIVKLVKQNNGN